MKRIVYSSHAKKRLFERPITRLQVRKTVYRPDYTIRRSEGEIEAYKDFDEKMLKVVYVEKENYIKIITLYWLT